MAQNKLIAGISRDSQVLQKLGKELHDLFSHDLQVKLFNSEDEALQELSQLLELNFEIPVLIWDLPLIEKNHCEMFERFQVISPATINIALGEKHDYDLKNNLIGESNPNYFLSHLGIEENLEKVVRQALKSHKKNCQLAEQRKKIEAMEKEIKHLNTALDRFVPHQFLELLKRDSIADLSLGDQVEQEMSVLFTDIRAFTGLSEMMTPQENFDFINGHFSRMEPLVVQNGGFVDKYIGDAIMALFRQSPDSAIQAGIDMLHSIKEYNRYCFAHQKPPIAMGIGINTGPLMLGTVGGKSKISTTVISDAVNLASRLESITKFYGVSMAISGYTYAQLENPDQFSARWIGYIPIKGKSKPVLVYEIFDTDEPDLKEGKLATQQMFETGCLLHRQGNLARAAKLFRRCVREVPGDQTAHTYLRLCQPYQPTCESSFGHLYNLPKAPSRFY